MPHAQTCIHEAILTQRCCVKKRCRVTWRTGRLLTQHFVAFDLTRLSIEVVQYVRFQNNYFWSYNSFVGLRTFLFIIQFECVAFCIPISTLTDSGK